MRCGQGSRAGHGVAPLPNAAFARFPENDASLVWLADVRLVFRTWLWFVDLIAGKVSFFPISNAG